MKFPPLAFSSPEKIRAFRKKTGMRQELFWERVGITQSGGSRYESGRNISQAVQVLLTITYGTEAQARKMTEALRAWRAE